MVDRASDKSTTYKNLRIDLERPLKCCSHVILKMDNATDNVYKNTEQSIGLYKLLAVSVGDTVFSSPNIQNIAFKTTSLSCAADFIRR